MTNPRDIHIHVSSWSFVKAVMIIALALALYYVRDIVLMVVASIVVASAVEPGTRFFMRNKLPRTLSVLTIYVATGAVLAVLFYGLVPSLLGDTADFIGKVPQYIESNSTALVGNFLPPEFSFSGLSQAFSLKEALNAVSASLQGYAEGGSGILGAVFGGLISFVIIVVLSFYFVAQEDGVGEFLRVIVPDKHEEYVVGLWKRSQNKIGLWMQGQMLLGVLVGLLAYLGLMILGVEHALLLGVLAGVFELVPLFGIVLSAVPAILVGFGQDGATSALLIIGLYTIIHQFESHLIYPLVVNKVVGVSPVLVIIALLVGAELAGFLGALLAVPISAALMEYYSDIRTHKAHLIK